MHNPSTQMSLSSVIAGYICEIAIDIEVVIGVEADVI